MRKFIPGLALAGLASLASAQHLWWKPDPTESGYTCLYGEVEVLATAPTIYYCGCNWWPGAPAGGYTGIQDQGNGTHNMIFSIWDTDKDLHPETVWKDPRTAATRFGGEGTGAHTHSDYNWQLGKTYRYFATKKQDASGANTLCTVFFYDEPGRRWVKEATISSPNNGNVSVKTFGGGLNAFLENWSGQNREAPKVALYRLWLGTTPKDLHEVLSGQGDGKWGATDIGFYLAEGDDLKLSQIPAGSQKGGSVPLQIRPTSLSKSVLRELNHLWAE
jgi:hypothetical protein